MTSKTDTAPKAPASRKRPPAASAEPAIAEAKRAATIPSRPVVEHTKLLRANLQSQRSLAADALASVDMEKATEAGIRDAAIEAAERAYELALAAASNARGGAIAIATERHKAVTAQLDAERDDLTRTLDGIDAALQATAPAGNVEPIRKDMGKAA